MKKQAAGAPVEIVEGKGIKIPIHQIQETKAGKIYTYFRLTYYRGGKRTRERATTIEGARSRGKTLIAELVGFTDQKSPLSPIERQAVDTALEVLAPLDIPLTEAARRLAEAERILAGRGTIEEAARLLVQQQERKELPIITVGELYEKFMGTLMTEEIPGRIESRVYLSSYRYWQDMSQRLGAAAVKFKTRKIADISSIELENFLDAIPKQEPKPKEGSKPKPKPKPKPTKATGRTRNNYRAALCTLFSYARKQRYLPRNEKTEAECIVKAQDNKTKKSRDSGRRRKIYTPEEIQKILDEIPDRWKSFIILGSFAGIRAAEIHRLDWQDVNFKKAIITVEKDQAKVGKRRIIRMSPQLVLWLKPLAEEKGWVCPHYSHDSTLNIEFGKARKKIDVPMVPNGHRHSYASYRLTEVNIPGEVAWEMGTSERKLKDNYLSLVDDDELAEWKNVLPKTG